MMRKTVQVVRIISIVVGVLLIFCGLSKGIWGYISSVRQYATQDGVNTGYMETKYFLEAIGDVASAIATGLFPLVLGLFLNPDRVAPLREKV